MLSEVTSGTLTINEMREAQGRDPVEWGDTWWMPFSLVSAGMEPEPRVVEEQPKSRTPLDGMFAKSKGYSKLFKQMF